MSKGLTQRSNYNTSRNVFSESRVIDSKLQDYMNKSILQLEHNAQMLKGTSVPHLENRVKTLQNMNVGMRPTKAFDNLY